MTIGKLNCGGKVTYVTLASGLNFKVLQCAKMGKLFRLELTRYSKHKEAYINSAIVVTNDGFYLPNEEVSQFDVVKFTAESGLENKIDCTTPAGTAHAKKSHFDLNAEILDQQTKIQTRNGLWYCVLGHYSNEDKTQVSLNLGLIGSESRTRHREYFVSGADYSLTPKEFSPHDIIRIERLMG